MQMHKQKATTKKERHVADTAATWDDMIRDAESEIDHSKRRIARLEGIVRVCKRMSEAGEPFPGESVSR